MLFKKEKKKKGFFSKQRQEGSKNTISPLTSLLPLPPTERIQASSPSGCDHKLAQTFALQGQSSTDCL